MAISKFKITKAPLRASIKISGIDYVLNQEYPISKQQEMVIDVLDRGVPYDSFGFKLGNENNVWSAEYTGTINVEVNSLSPELSDFTVLVKENESNDIFSSFLFNDSTDRIKILSKSPFYGNIYLNNSDPIINKTYMLYDINEIAFVSSYSGEEQNVESIMTLSVGNKSSWSNPVTVTLKSRANLRAEITSSSLTEAALTTI